LQQQEQRLDLQESLDMLQMLQDMRQVPQASAEVLSLVAHGRTVVKQNCVQIDIFAKH